MYDLNDSKQILAALAAGVAGDPDSGLRSLQPIINRGPAATYALLAALAETATFIAREQDTGDFFWLHVSHIGPDEVTQISADELPAPIRFAAQFVTAWANRDEDLAGDLFDALVNAEQVGAGITAVYEAALVTATAIVERQAER